MDIKLLQKIETLKTLFEEFELWYSYYQKWENEQKKGAFLAAQKKAEELVEYSIKINREILKKSNVFAHSYRDSFLFLEKVGFDNKLSKKLGDLALFRNRLAHEYLTITDEEIQEELIQIKENYPNYTKEILKIISQ